MARQEAKAFSMTNNMIYFKNKVTIGKKEAPLNFRQHQKRFTTL
jgi:hypothetical protein